MADLTANTALDLGPILNIGALMGASQTFYAGALVAIDQATGYTEHMDDDPGLLFVGICPAKQVSNSSKNDITAATEVTGQFPAIMPLYPYWDRYGFDITVAGVTAQTDWGKFVYATDDSTMTLTAPADDRAPVGIIWRYKSSGVADVLFFDPMQSALFTLIGTYGQVWMAQLNAGFGGGGGTAYTKTLHGIHGTFTDFYVNVGIAGATTSGTSTFQAKVGAGSNMFASAAIMPVATMTKGAEVKVSSLSNGTITAADAVFHDGDVITITCIDGGTAMTAMVAQVTGIFQRNLGV